MSDLGRGILVKACLNGGRRRPEHEATPLTASELSADARAAVAEGAAAVHVHPRDSDGAETLDAASCDAAVAAIRRACPGVPVGLSTAAWIAPDPGARLSLIERWTLVPDFVSVNVSEPGTAELCELLVRRGIGIEAGVWTVRDAQAFAAAGWAPRCLRVLVEAQPRDPREAVSAAAAIDAVLDDAGITLPRVHHGEGPATWAVLEEAVDRGYDIRVGLEDTLHLADGRLARDNAELVAAAVAIVRRRGRRPAATR